MGMTDEEVDKALRAARLLMFKHPVAVQAAFSAFVEEGRRFSATSEGKALRETLATSDGMHQLRAVFEVGTMNALTASDTSSAPTAIVEACARVLSERHLAERLSRVFEGDD